MSYHFYHALTGSAVINRRLLEQTIRHDSLMPNDILSIYHDLERLRAELRERSSLIIVESSVNTYENNVDFNMWAKVVLTTLGDKNWWFLHSPTLHQPEAPEWNVMISRYVLQYSFDSHKS
jgi:hypothetical protein